jgi:hypothetical protein
MMKIPHPARLSGGLAIVLLAGLHAAVPYAALAQPRYTAQFISPNFSALNAAAMNEHGDVVGTASSGTGGWVSRGGAAAVYLPLPAGTISCIAADINEAGVIVGSVTLATNLRGRAASWMPDGAGGYTIQQFGVLPGYISSGATAINNVGDIVGSSHNGIFARPVLFTTGGGVVDLSATGVFNPKDVNDSRIVLDVQFRRLNLNTMTVENLGHPGVGYIGAVGEVINESGQAAGSAVIATSTSCDHQAARYTDGIGWQIFSSCGPVNSVWDMNDHGDVVMQLNIAPYVRFEGMGGAGAETFRIEDLIENSIGHWSVLNGYGITINNRRQMVVPATNQATSQGGLILLTPLGGPTGCYANCDGSTAAPILNVDDFTCFINEFAAAQSLPPAQQVGHTANCDGSTAAPVLNVDDFTCFINAFAVGCR